MVVQNLSRRPLPWESDGDMTVPSLQIPDSGLGGVSRTENVSIFSTLQLPPPDSGLGGFRLEQLDKNQQSP